MEDFNQVSRLALAFQENDCKDELQPGRWLAFMNGFSAASVEMSPNIS